MRFTHTVLLNSLFEEKNKKAREEKDSRKGRKEVEIELVSQYMFYNVLVRVRVFIRSIESSCMHVRYGTVDDIPYLVNTTGSSQ